MDEEDALGNTSIDIAVLYGQQELLGQLIRVRQCLFFK